MESLKFKYFIEQFKRHFKVLQFKFVNEQNKKLTNFLKFLVFNAFRNTIFHSYGQWLVNLRRKCVLQTACYAEIRQISRNFLVSRIFRNGLIPKICPSWHILVQRQQWNYQSNKWNLLQLTVKKLERRQWLQ